MNFRLVYLAALLCLAACSGSSGSNNNGTFSGETNADALEKAKAEVAAFKANGLAEANAEIKILKDESAKTKAELLAELEALKADIAARTKDVAGTQAELDKLRTDKTAAAGDIKNVESRLTRLQGQLTTTQKTLEAMARTTADMLKKTGQTKDAAEVLRQAGLLDEAEALLKAEPQVVVAPVAYEPFPTLYKVALPDGTKGLPAPKSPPMGWNAWNTFRCNVSEDLILKTADAIVKNGMLDAGYTYINLDDCWEGGRDSDGTLKTNDEFPSGIKVLADKIHGKGLKLGIYTTSNTRTCAVFGDNFPEAKGVGSLGYEELDARTFAEWGVDYLKYDYCRGPEDRLSFVRMRDALAATGKNIFYSANFDGLYPGRVLDDQPRLDIPGIAHTARVDWDIENFFDSTRRLLESGRRYQGYATPGFWNDLDMLQVGNTVPSDNRPILTLEENKTHFAMWAMMASPLLAGNDVRNQSAETLKILTNKDLIAINQDPLNAQAIIVREDSGGMQIWNKPLAEIGARAVALLNLTNNAASMTIKWSQLGLDDTKPVDVRDLSRQADIGVSETEYTTTVPAHGVIVLKAEGSEIPFPSGTSALSDRPWIYQINNWGPIEKDRSNGEEKANDGPPLSIRNVAFVKGLGVSAPTQIFYRPADKCSQLTVAVGVDDYYFTKPEPERKGKGNVAFEIWGDGNLLAESGVMTPYSPKKTLTADLADVSTLRLIVKPSDDKDAYDYPDWADPKITCQ